MTTEPPPDNATVALHDLAAAIRQGKDTRDIARRLAHHWPDFPHRSHGLLVSRIHRARAATGTASAAPFYLQPVKEMSRGERYLLVFQGTTTTSMILIQNDDAIITHNVHARKATCIYRIASR